MGVKEFQQKIKSGELLNERQKLLPEDREFHYLMSEMVEPLIGATIKGGAVIGDGSPEFPHMPVLFIEQNGERYSVVISSDDEGNDGGRIMIEHGSVVMGETTANAAIREAV
jgi:ribulose-5-phosphate 4-epimerase/fuculose-1-phosphate aldolase